MTGNVESLKAMLDVAVDQGVVLYQGTREASIEEILQVQRVYEEARYMPDFIVKNDSGEIKEIWYGEIRSRAAY